MIFLYYGDNSFLIQEKLAAVRAKFEEKFSSGLNFWKFDLEDDYSDLKSAFASQSMFDEKKLVFLRGVFSVPENSWEGIKKETEKILKSADVIAIFYHFGCAETAAVKKRVDFFVLNGKSEEFKNFDRLKTINWILDRSRVLGIKIGRSEAAYLSDNIGLDLNKISNEINKLALYKPGDVLSKKDIETAVPFEITSNSFKAIDSLLRLDAPSALKSLEDQKTNNDDPLMILGALIWQFRILAKMSDMKKAPAEAVAKEIGISPWIAKKSLAALNNFSFGKIKNIYQGLADADVAIKTGQKDGHEALSDFLMFVCEH